MCIKHYLAHHKQPYSTHSLEAGPTVDEPEFAENKHDYWYDASKPFPDLCTGLVLLTDGVMQARCR